jgi:uncharacterized integral membrane protein
MTPKADSGGGSTARDFFTVERVLVLILVAITLLFIFQNTRQTKITLLLVEVSMPLWVALFGTLLVGGLCGYLLQRRGPRRTKA